MNARWRMILPVKGTDRAKSRLALVDPTSRIALARAMALDSVSAVLACELVESVIVVTSDPVTAREMSALGVRVEPDPHGGLNAAIEAGGRAFGAGGDAGLVGVLLADVPALRPVELSAALQACSAHDRAFVPDQEGTGTVLLTASRPDRLRPQFGAGSAARHERHATRLDLDLPGLRRDVDTVESLAQAVALGVGQRTAVALSTAG